jgi:hypothetical protein
MASGLMKLVQTGYEHAEDDFKKELLQQLVNNIGTEDYQEALMTFPFKEPAVLSELGPLLRLQCLFKLINEKHALMLEIKLTLAREIFRNIEMINDLSMLKEVELGRKGAAFYADCAQSAVYLGRKW